MYDKYHIKSWMVVCIVIVLILLVMVLTIDMPEMLVDESFSSVQNLSFLMKKTVFRSDAYFLGSYFPIISEGKHGAAEIYLFSPFMYLSNNMFIGLRFGYIFWLALILLLTYYFARFIFNPFVAVATIIFLAVDFSFLRFAKMGSTFGLTIPFFSLAAMIMFLYWHKKRKNYYLYIGVALLAIGFQTRGYFLWQIMAILTAGIFTVSSLKRIGLRPFLFAVFVFLLVASPLLLYFFNSGFFSFLSGNITVAQYRGSTHNNFDIVNNLITRINNLNDNLAGSGFLGSFSKYFNPLFFWICFCFLSLRLLGKKKTYFSKNKLTFILVLFSATLFFSTFTLTIYYPGHLWMLYPFVQIIISVAVFEVWKITKKRFIKTTIIILSVIFLLFNFLNCIDGFSNLVKEKQRISNSSISDLANWLQANNIKKVIGFDLSMICGVRFFSKLQIEANIFDYRPNPEYIDYEVRKGVSSDVFVVDSKNLDRFQNLLKEFNKKARIIKRFNFSNGSARFIVYVLQ